MPDTEVVLVYRGLRLVSDEEVENDEVQLEEPTFSVRCVVSREWATAAGLTTWNEAQLSDRDLTSNARIVIGWMWKAFNKANLTLSTVEHFNCYPNPLDFDDIIDTHALTLSHFSLEKYREEVDDLEPGRVHINTSQAEFGLHYGVWAHWPRLRCRKNEPHPSHWYYGQESVWCDGVA